MRFGWFLLGFLVLALAERLYERRFSQQAERGQRTLEWVMTTLHLLYGMIYAGTALEVFLRPRPVNWPVTAAGLLLFVVALVVRLTAIRALGRFWSLHLEIRPQHQLVITGPYARVRHPAYTAIMVEVLAIPLVGQAYWTLALALFVYIPVLLIRWRNEEREMIGKFGEQYLQYRQRVPAFLPGARARKAPTSEPLAPSRMG